MQRRNIKQIFSKEFFSKDFFRYFICFLCVSLSIVFVFSFCNKYYFSSEFKTQSIKSNESALVQLRNASDIIMSDINASLTSVILDPDFSNYKDSFSTTRKFDTINKLEQINMSNKYFLDMALYYPKEGYIISPNSGINEISEYFDKDYIVSLAEKDNLYNHAEMRTKYDLDTNRNISVITMTKTIPLNSSADPTAIVVIDIDPTSLNKAVKSIKADGTSSVVITNVEGNIITQNRDFQDFDFKKLYSENKETTVPNTFITKINGEKMFVSQLSSASYKWRYFYFTPVSSLDNMINKINGFILLLGILVLIFSTIIIYMLTQVLYNPIKQLASRFSSDSEEKGDFALINENVDKLININKDLSMLLSDYNMYLKNKFLEELIMGDFEDSDSISASMEYYNIDVDIDKDYIVLALSVDISEEPESEQEYTKKSKDMLMIYIQELISDKILSQYKGFSITQSEGRYIIAINLDGNKTDEQILEISHDIANKIDSLVLTSLNHPFTIGVGSPCNGITNISTSYNEAIFALNYKFIQGYNNHIIFYENINTLEKSKLYPYEIEKKIYSSLKAADREALSQSMNQFAAHLLDNPPEADVARLFFIQLLSATLRCIQEMNIEFSDISLSQNEIYTEILNAPTIDSLLSRMNSLYDSILEFENTKRENINQNTLSQINNYIKFHLSEDLSINRLAEIFYLSPSYLRKIYKGEFSITLKQHIDNERMEYAKELLENSDISLSDLPEKIGYLSSNSFSRAFKTHTGMTPRDYRALSTRRKIK